MNPKEANAATAESRRSIAKRGPSNCGAAESATARSPRGLGTADHLVPLESNRPVLDLLPGLDNLEFPAGHVGLIVGSKAHRVSIPGMLDWIEDHSDRS